LPAIDAGLSAAGKPARGSAADRFDIVSEVIVCCGHDQDELAVAQAGVRRLLAFYGSTPAYRAVLEVEGYADLQPELNAASKRGEWATMAELIDDTLLRTIAVHGSPADCATQIMDRYGEVATRLAVYQPYAANPDTTAELLDELRAATPAPTQEA
jgi:alkanesulfonate monooxygenase SsuD/methylene tetrahydromethanopterin reductase-like flavin-dependent oxidoreductase (luciferase family)